MGYKFYYGTENNKIDITEKINDFIPNGDTNRATLFGDPCVGTLKSIFVEHPDGTMFKYNDRVKINTSDLTTEEIIYPVIVSVAKLESDYIEEWVIYHLALGFEHIYIYDNEDQPVYKELLKNYSSKVTINHIPGNNYHKPIQYLILDYFITNYMRNGIITHCTHIDIDEFIVLKKHKCINEFIKEYIHGNCIGIGMNWRFFGDSGLKEKTNEPVTQRFKLCQKNSDNQIKTIFDVSKTSGWSICHAIYKPEGCFVKATSGNIIEDVINDECSIDVIQLNHYKTKTLPEFKYIRTRGRADLMINPEDDLCSNFEYYNKNDETDLYAYNFYKNINKYSLININDYINSKFEGILEGNCSQIPHQMIDLKELSKGKKNILEIGFNAGNSSCIFLENGCNVVSFDLNCHKYVKIAKEYIDNRFPNKHTLILGDSTITVPEYTSNIKFDVIFIDGGHDYNVAKADFENCQRFAHADTIFIVDDITYNSEQSYTTGPTKIWNELKNSGKLTEINHKEYGIGRGMSWGKLNADLIVVYYIFLPKDRNWKSIVEGQLNDLKLSKINYSSINIHICSEYPELINSCKDFINNTIKATIYTSSENYYEYPGLKLLYELSQSNPESILFYMHSKGMVFTNIDNTRSGVESLIFRNTIIHHTKIMEIFNDKNINKVGLFPTENGAFWFNFFFIRANYIKKCPEINPDRFYYEHFIGNDNYFDCYSLITNKICYYPQPNAVYAICNPTQDMLDNSSYFDKINYKFYYGTETNKIDISEKIKLNCVKDNIIFIPSGDNNRANLFGDPLPGILKSIFINEREFKDYSKIYINNVIYQIDEIPQNFKLLDNKYKWKKLKKQLKIKYGSFEDECPEQLMAIKFLTGSEKVLEIGANIGRNTLIIASLLNDSSNLVTMETDINTFEQLNENKRLNNLNFFTENSALSSKKLIQKFENCGSYCIQSDVLLENYSFVNTMTLSQLKEKYPINFDTLVLDCEGAFYYILQDFPEILNGINLIIMENDYLNIVHKEYIDSVLKPNGFNVIYTEGNGWGPCKDYFYQVWKRSLG
jgi:FkbM family methyltransferase